MSGTSQTNLLINPQLGSSLEFYGVDCSVHTGNLVNSVIGRGRRVRFVNCKMGIGVTRISGFAPTTGNEGVELIGSSDETGLASGESVRDYAKEYFRGTILSEATFVRRGGANDSVAGWSFAITPRMASTKEGLLSLATPWFGGLIKGDGSTSKDFTFYVANSSGADKTKAAVWAELFIPSPDGDTQHKYFTSRTAIDVSSVTLEDDPVSNWSTGAGGKNAQKIVFTAIPNYTGPIYGRIHYAEAGTDTLYADAKVHVTNT